MRLVKWILPPLIIAGAAFIFIQLKATKPELPPQTPQERAWTVLATSAAPESQSPRIELYAEVENPRQVTLKASIAAEIAAVEMRAGARFNKGDLLISLDTREIDFQIQQQRAQRDALNAQLDAEILRHQTDIKALEIEQEISTIAQRSLERQTDLSKRNLASREQLDTAEMNFAQRRLNLVSRQQAIADHPNRVAQLEASISQIQSQIDSLELDRDRAQVVAPFEGRLNSLSVSKGDRVRSGDSMARIYPSSELEVRAQLPLKLLPLIKMANGELRKMSASIEVDGREMLLMLDRLSAEVSAGSAGVNGIFRFTDTNYAPEPGRTLSMQLNLPAIDNLIALPPVALYGTDRVYRVTDSRLEAVSVEHYGDGVSPTGDPLVLIRSEQINLGDTIITTQLPNAVSGMLVEVRE